MRWVWTPLPVMSNLERVDDMKKNSLLSLYLKAFFAALVIAVFSGCASSGSRPKPMELAPLLPMMSVKQVWSSPFGANTMASSLSVHGSQVFVASGNGAVALIDVNTGADIWRMNVGTGLSAGIGADGHLAAVIGLRNELIALVGGKEVWRQRLNAASYTAPLVAGQRVFVLGADRSVTAYDGNSGARLWTQSRTGEPLVLRQSGVLLAVGDTLVAGLGGRMIGFNPNNGSIRWEVQVAAPKGGNDVERMIDLIAPVSRFQDELCVRAFQIVVACVDAKVGRLKWTQPSDGRFGLGGDDASVFGTESDGHVVAWNRATGQKIWTQSGLLYRNLSSPLALGRSIAVPDGFGIIHLLSREDGTPMARLPTDGSPIVSAPVLAGDTLLALTQNGNLFAWRP